MHAPKTSIMVLAGFFVLSCTTAEPQPSGPLHSLDRRQACIEAPNPSDEKAVQCYPLNLRRVADHAATRAAWADRVDFTDFDAFDESALIAETAPVTWSPCICHSLPRPEG